jgi:hypothetical protein
MHIMLLSLFEFCKNLQRKGHILLAGINKITHVYCKAIRHFESKKHFGNICVLGQSTLFAVKEHLYMNIQLMGYVYSSIQTLLCPCMPQQFISERAAPMNIHLVAGLQ